MTEPKQILKRSGDPLRVLRQGDVVRRKLTELEKTMPVHSRLGYVEGKADVDQTDIQRRGGLLPDVTYVCVIPSTHPADDLYEQWTWNQSTDPADPPFMKPKELPVERKEQKRVEPAKPKAKARPKKILKAQRKCWSNEELGLPKGTTVNDFDTPEERKAWRTIREQALTAFLEGRKRKAREMLDDRPWLKASAAAVDKILEARRAERTKEKADELKRLHERRGDDLPLKRARVDAEEKKAAVPAPVAKPEEKKEEPRVALPLALPVAAPEEKKFVQPPPDTSHKRPRDDDDEVVIIEGDGLKAMRRDDGKREFKDEVAAHRVEVKVSLEEERKAREAKEAEAKERERKSAEINALEHARMFAARKERCFEVADELRIPKQQLEEDEKAMQELESYVHKLDHWRAWNYAAEPPATPEYLRRLQDRAEEERRRAMPIVEAPVARPVPAPAAAPPLRPPSPAYDPMDPGFVPDSPSYEPEAPRYRPGSPEYSPLDAIYVKEPEGKREEAKEEKKVEEKPKDNSKPKPEESKESHYDPKTMVVRGRTPKKPRDGLPLALCTAENVAYLLVDRVVFEDVATGVLRDNVDGSTIEYLRSAFGEQGYIAEVAHVVDVEPGRMKTALYIISRRDIDEKDPSKYCVLCTAMRAVYAQLPCGHKTLCYGCYEKEIAKPMRESDSAVVNGGKCLQCQVAYTEIVERRP